MEKLAPLPPQIAGAACHFGALRLASVGEKAPSKKKMAEPGGSAEDFEGIAKWGLGAAPPEQSPTAAAPPGGRKGVSVAI